MKKLLKHKGLLLLGFGFLLIVIDGFANTVWLMVIGSVTFGTGLCSLRTVNPDVPPPPPPKNPNGDE